MAHRAKRVTGLAALLAATAALGLSACANEQPKDYETDVTDESGGELIVEDANAPGVDVNLPETEMTPASEGEESAAPSAD